MVPSFIHKKVRYLLIRLCSILVGNESRYCLYINLFTEKPSHISFEMV